MQDKKVSIIITTYKGSETINNSVMSALNQDYDNIEIIVVDDNGKNTEEQIKTEMKLKELINQNRIRYYAHENNKNGSAARNTGAMLATGDYITFLDDDDLYLESKVKNQLKTIIENNSDMVICGGYYTNQKGVGYKTRFFKKEKLLLSYLTEKTLFNSSSIFIKKEKFEQLNGFDETFKRHQDWEFCTRAICLIKVDILDDFEYIKFNFGRNISRNPETSEMYINHFFEKMETTIFNYDKEVYKKVYNYQMLRIAKEYYFDKKKQDFIRIMKKTTYKHYYLALFVSVIKHLIKKTIYGNRKRSKTYKEYSILLQE